jgi:phage virion morphogenesis protein
MADYNSEALAALDQWFGQVLEGLSPAMRKRAAMKLGKALRRSNLDRIASNVEPGGKSMEKRKARLDQRGRLRRKAGGKMFRKLRLAREWSIKASPDSVEIMPAKGDNVAATHHFGLKGFVGRAPDGSKVYTRYPERRLLGFDKADEDLVLDVVAEMFER